KGSYEKVVSNIAVLRANEVAVRLTTTVTALNRDALSHVRLLAETWSLPLTTSPVFPAGFAVDNWKELVGEYSDIISSCSETPVSTGEVGRVSGDPQLQFAGLGSSPSKGHDCQRSFAVQRNGLVTPCLMIRDEKHAFGNQRNG